MKNVFVFVTYSSNTVTVVPAIRRVFKFIYLLTYSNIWWKTTSTYNHI